MFKIDRPVEINDSRKFNNKSIEMVETNDLNNHNKSIKMIENKGFGIQKGAFNIRKNAQALNITQKRKMKIIIKI